MRRKDWSEIQPADVHREAVRKAVQQEQKTIAAILDAEARKIEKFDDQTKQAIHDDGDSYDDSFEAKAAAYRHGAELIRNRIRDASKVVIEDDRDGPERQIGSPKWCQQCGAAVKSECDTGDHSQTLLITFLCGGSAYWRSVLMGGASGSSYSESVYEKQPCPTVSGDKNQGEHEG